MIISHERLIFTLFLGVDIVVLSLAGVFGQSVGERHVAGLHEWQQGRSVLHLPHGVNGGAKRCAICRLDGQIWRKCRCKYFLQPKPVACRNSPFYLAYYS